jgi:hypothetical protein
MKMELKNFLKFKRLKFIALIVLTPILLSWGALAHEHINRAAVLSLPAPMLSFFYNHIDFITEEASVPDLRKYTLNDKAEDPRHYVDLENFGSPDSLPVSLAELRQKYSPGFLQKNGILPWYIEEMMEKLTKAFKEKRKAEILFLAADLGHYLGDTNTPLHTTVNYDGQLTNQKGIHSFWETKLFTMFSDTYNYYSGETVYITDIHKEVWHIINHSRMLADTILLLDKELRKQLQGEQGNSLDSLGNISGKPKFTGEYVRLFHEKLNGMIEKQARSSIKATASFWYTAWVNAGKPDLSDLDPVQQTAGNKQSLRKELKLFKKGKLIDIKILER